MIKAFKVKPLLAKRAWELYRRKGIRSVIDKALQEFGRRNPLKQQMDPRTGLIAFGTNSSAIFSNVDLPVEGKEETTDTLYVSGWACSMTGIKSIDLFLDKQHSKRIQTGAQRADVGEAHPSVPNANKSGFATDVSIDNLQMGKHELLVAFHDRAGNSRLVARTFKRSDPLEIYHAYYLKNLVSPGELKAVKRQMADVEKLPSFEIWVDCTKGDDFEATLRSLSDQEYPNWSCHVVAGQADHRRLRIIIDAVADDDLKQRIQVIEQAYVNTDRGSAINIYYGFLRAGETLSANALYLFSQRCCEDPDASVIYSDHDLTQAGGLHLRPYFKPDWSPDYLLSRNYIGGFFLIKSSNGFSEHLSECFDPGRLAWRFDLLLRLTDGWNRVAHIPRVLWSRPVTNPVAALEQEEEQVVVQQALDRRNLAATVTPHSPNGIRRIAWPIVDNPKVSIIIPTTGQMDHLQPCVDSITEKTAYPNYELVFIDNGRGKHADGIAYLHGHGLKVIERDEPFNWAKLNNDGARVSDGELLLFLNDDVAVVDENWLTELVSQAIRPDIGAVGAQLLYPNGRIQHAGIFLVGHGGGAMHFFHGLDPDRPIYQDLHKITREVSANTGACLMVQRSHFDQIGGFDEELAIAGNDVDFCLRLAERGYRNLWTPHCTLLHHESVSRSDISIELDEKKIWDRWADLLRTGDPYFNSNFVQNRPDLVTDFSGGRRAAASAAARKEAGINLIGYIRAEMGIGEATRGEARAMDEASVPFVVIDYNYGNPARKCDDTWAHKITDKPVFDINLLHVNADLTPQAFFALPSELFSNRYTIGFWAWELPEFPDDWLSSFTLVNEVWVPSAFVQDAVSRKSTVPVVRIPHAVSIPSGPFLERQFFGLPDSAYQFLVMYDINSVPERKNPKGAIHVFKETFAPDDATVSLVIKLNNADHNEIDELNTIIDGYHNIFIIDRTLARHEVISLHACSDCFLSLHRSEGFGLTIAESMSVGKPVIATHWSGNVDFMNEQNAACINYELVKLDKDLGPYKAGQYWAEPNLEHASWWMKKLRDEPASGAKMGRHAKEQIAREFSPLRVGQLIRERLKYIRHS